ncbi:unnamed protein product [Vitrella brassicaformis CCMP3155]|uniref:Uncharacterized protein n=2 Tax=Vitrella brassicaformis TaxID=1169539 RepID=A0A0G4EC55_VITBC|nr:unnamed protein product [Vitrella brassicaformis CCMP3155]|eukprot:CEL93273.1 unnamed protein product [Vitrella brassicaformis CCMP3155]
MGQKVGVYVGCMQQDWLLMQHEASSLAATGSASSILSNRISYVFGLKGPSLTIDTACSSSLVATDLGAKALMHTDACRQGALVAGVNLMMSQHSYVAECRAQMLSIDGRSKTFDASANGYVRGEGVAAALLQRLDRPGEVEPFAVIRGSASNHNAMSASLTAPAGPAQQQVIREALREADLSPSALSFAETHGTGTPLGDPIEVSALKSVFGGKRPAWSPLVLGAVKTNIGHTEGAAGIASLIKVILTLRHGLAPPNLHLKQLNPYIDSTGDFPFVMPVQEGGGLRLNTTDDTSHTGTLIGSASAFGFGGSNAHIIVESRVGPLSRGIPGSHAVERARPLVTFLFTGQGAQYVEMGKGLYETDDVFRVNLDRCAAFVDPHLPRPMLGLMYPSTEGELSDTARAELQAVLNETRYSQPVLFSLDYSLAQSLIHRGVSPDMVIGHSLGEYVAATVAGVMSLEVGLSLVVVRARLMYDTPPQDGVMAALLASEDEVLKGIKQLKDGESSFDSLAVAAVNGPRKVVVAGKRSEVSTLLKALKVDKDGHKMLPVSHAFHSPLLGSTVPLFRDAILNELSTTPLQEPSIPLISTVTGRTASAGQLTSADYWAEHITKTVRFMDAVNSAIKAAEGGPGVQFIEVGPQPTLIKLARSFLKGHALDKGVTLLAPMDKKGDASDLLDSVVRTVKDWKSANVKQEKKKGWLDTDYDWNHQPHSWLPCGEQYYGQVDDGGPSHPLLGRPTRVSFPSPSGDERHSHRYEATFERRVRRDVLRMLKDHVVSGVPIMPAAAYIETICEAARSMTKTDGSSSQEDASVCVRGIVFEKPLKLSDELHLHVTARQQAGQNGATVITLCSSSLESNSSGPRKGKLTQHATGRLTSAQHSVSPSMWFVGVAADSAAVHSSHSPHVESVDALKDRCPKEVDVETLYQGLRDAGLSYGPAFRTITWLRAGEGEVLACLQEHDGCIAASSSSSIAGTWTLHPAVLDGALQSAAALLSDAKEDHDTAAAAHGPPAPMVPVRVEKALVVGSKSSSPASAICSHARLVSRAARAASLDITLTDMATGDLLASLQGVQVRQMDVTALVLATEETAEIEDSRYKSDEACALTDEEAEMDAAGMAAHVREVVLASATEVMGAAASQPSKEGGAAVLACLQEHDGCIAASSSSSIAGTWTLHPAVLDGALQSAAALLSDAKEDHDTAAAAHGPPAPMVPVRVEKALVVGSKSSSPASAICSHARLVSRAARAASLDITLTDMATGDLLASLQGVQVRQMDVTRSSATALTDMLWETKWEGPVEREQKEDASEEPACPRLLLLGLTPEWIARFDASRVGLFDASLVPFGHISKYGTDELKAMLSGATNSSPWDAIIYLGGADDQDHDPLAVLEECLALSQALDGMVSRKRGSESQDVVAPMWLVTRGVHAISGESEAAAAALPRHAGLWGFARSVRLELAASSGRLVPFGCVDLDSRVTLATDAGRDDVLKVLVSSVIKRETGDMMEIALRQPGVDGGDKHELFYSQLVKSTLKTYVAHSALVSDNGCYVISGGLGFLGLLTAKWLAEQGARHIVLLSRRGQPTQSVLDSPLWELLTTVKASKGVELECMACDVASLDQCEGVVKAMSSRDLTIKGFFHSAGVLHDAPLAKQSRQTIESVFQAKVVGAWNFHSLLDSSSLDHFVMYSSVAAVFGNLGQANYSAANACLDALATHRRSHGKPAVSIQWGPWTEGGMASPQVISQLGKVGIRGLTNEVGLQLLGDIMAARESVRTVSCIGVEWSKFLSLRPPDSQRFFEIIKRQHPDDNESPGEEDEACALTDEEAEMDAAGMAAHVREVVLASATEVMGAAASQPSKEGGAAGPGSSDQQQKQQQQQQEGSPPAALGDVPFNDLGIDSLGLVEFRDAVARKLRVKLSVSLLFDYPTINALIGYIVGEKVALLSRRRSPNKAAPGSDTLAAAYHAIGQRDPPPQSLSSAGATVSAVGVMGLACRFPGGANSLSTFWDVLREGRNCVTTIPRARWNAELFYDPAPLADSNTHYTREGAFIDKVELFDNQFFKISPREARAMDPQQRHVLEVSYEAFHSAGVFGSGQQAVLAALMGQKVGVYVGCMQQDWLLMQHEASSLAATGSASSILSNRISYVFGLKGPSLTIDTACSSSLVATDLGAKALMHTDACRQGALVAGVNLMMSQHSYVAECR